MATHSSILAWETPWTEKPGGLQSMGCKELDTTEQLNNKKTIPTKVTTHSILKECFQSFPHKENYLYPHTLLRE